MEPTAPLLDPAHRAALADAAADLSAGACGLAAWLLEVAAEHSFGDPGEPRSVHLMALGGPAGPAILVCDAAVVAAAALLLHREASSRHGPPS